MRDNVKTLKNPCIAEVNGSFSAIFDPEGRMLVVESINSNSPEHPRGGHGELELAGGGSDFNLDSTILDTARRETIEELGLDILQDDLTDITVTALSRSNEKAAYTGLVVVQYATAIPFDPAFSSDETNSALLIDPIDFIQMPTIEEDPDAQHKTYRAHRIMAAHALIITQEGVSPGDPVEMLFPPFKDQRLTTHLARHYDDYRV